MLWLDHWELIFPFTNTNWDTEKSYLKYIFNIVTVIVFLVSYFRLSFVAFSCCSLFLNHHFTSIDLFLSWKCFHNLLLCCVTNLCKPLHVGRCNVMTTASSGSVFLVCDTSCTVLPLHTSEFATIILFLVLEASSTLLWESLLSSCKDHCNTNETWFA